MYISGSNLKFNYKILPAVGRPETVVGHVNSLSGSVESPFEKYGRLGICDDLAPDTGRFVAGYSKDLNLTRFTIGSI